MTNYHVLVSGDVSHQHHHSSPTTSRFRSVVDMVLLCDLGAGRTGRAGPPAVGRWLRWGLPSAPCGTAVPPGSSLPTTGADRKSTRLNSSHVKISYAVFCLKKKSMYTLRIL